MMISGSCIREGFEPRVLGTLEGLEGGVAMPQVETDAAILEVMGVMKP